MDDQELQKAEKIERYLKGIMPLEERKAFENEIAQDNELRDEVVKTDIASQAIRYQGLRNEVKTIRETMLTESEGKSDLGTAYQKETVVRPLPFGRYAFRVAASLLILLLSFAALQMAVINPQNIFAEKINYEVVDVVERSDEESASLSTILESYQKNSFQDAAAIFSNLENPTVKETYIGAAAYLKLEQFDIAIQYYQQILEGAVSGSRDYWQQRAAYNLAITFVRVGRYEEAITILKELKSNPEYGDYYDQLVSDYALWKLSLLEFRSAFFE